MTNRQRFQETMRFGSPDHVPYFEEGIRKDVIQNWYKQGFPRGSKISDLFQTDQFYEIALEYDPLSTLRKKPTSRDELVPLRKTKVSDRPWQYWRKKQKLIRSSIKRDHVLFLRIHRGFFLSMGVYDWERFNEVISLSLENPDFVAEAMQIQGELIAKLLDKVLPDLQIDAAIFNEPIGGNEGPIISPAMYEELVLDSYKPILEILDKHGIETIILRTYANMRLLIPSILKYGFNCLWACETDSRAMDYLDIRKEFGRQLRLIGGIDLDSLRYDKSRIHMELIEKVPQLIASGGYVPLADGRVRKDIPFENYAYYRKLLEQLIREKTKPRNIPD
jgi:hypothetical protein